MTKVSISANSATKPKNPAEWLDQLSKRKSTHSFVRTRTRTSSGLSSIGHTVKNKHDREKIVAKDFISKEMTYVLFFVLRLHLFKNK